MIAIIMKIVMQLMLAMLTERPCLFGFQGLTEHKIISQFRTEVYNKTVFSVYLTTIEATKRQFLTMRRQSLLNT